MENIFEMTTSLPQFPFKSNPKWCGIVAFSNFSSVVWKGDIWYVFRVRARFSNFSGFCGQGVTMQYVSTRGSVGYDRVFMRPFVPVSKPRLVQSLSSRSLRPRFETRAPQAQNRWCMRKLVYIENCMGKSPIVKKNCVRNYLIWNKVFLPQTCRKLVSCADFKAILMPFSGVIWNRYSSF